MEVGGIEGGEEGGSVVVVVGAERAPEARHDTPPNLYIQPRACFCEAIPLGRDRGNHLSADSRRNLIKFQIIISDNAWPGSGLMALQSQGALRADSHPHLAHTRQLFPNRSEG